MKKFSQIFKKIANLIFPVSKVEWAVFGIAFLVYGIFAGYIALNYTVIFDNRIPWDAYFSFDNRAIVLTGGGFERHPLSNYFFDAVREFALLFSGNKFNEIFRLVLALISAFTVSLSVMHVFRYLAQIIKLPIWICVLITLFFGLFSTSILLSFTPETYTFTLLLLLVFNNYAAEKISQGEKISGSSLVLAGVSVGGLTITNIAKVFVPVLFEKNLFKSWKAFLNAALRVFISVLVFVLLYLNRVNFDVSRIFSKTGTQYEKFSKPINTPLWDMIVSWFWGGNMVFSPFVIRDYHNQKKFHYKALFMETVQSPWVLGFLFILLLIVLISYASNFKNKVVQILMISFSLDVIIHCILKFGLHTSYIYGGHFIFIVPFMIGWLFLTVRRNTILFTFSAMIMILLVIFITMNNFYRLEEFLFFLDRFYKA